MFNVNVIELFDGIKLSSSWNKLFSNYEAACKYAKYCLNTEEYEEKERYVSDKNGDFKLTNIRGEREEIPGIKNTILIEILEEEPLESFDD